MKNRIHAILADHGVGVERNLGTGPGREWLVSVELPVVSRQVIEDSLGLIDPTDTVVRELKGRLSGALCRLPGIGPLTALYPGGRDR